jgi:hypothetical protein
VWFTNQFWRKEVWRSGCADRFDVVDIIDPFRRLLADDGRSDCLRFGGCGRGECDGYGGDMAE